MFLHLVLLWVIGKAWGNVVGSYGKSPIYLCLFYCGVCTCIGGIEFVKFPSQEFYRNFTGIPPGHRFSTSAFGQRQVPGKSLEDGKGQENTLKSNHLLSNCFNSILQHICLSCIAQPFTIFFFSSFFFCLAMTSSCVL